MRGVPRLSEKFQGELLVTVKNEDAVLLVVAFSDVVVAITSDCYVPQTEPYLSGAPHRPFHVTN